MCVVCKLISGYDSVKGWWINWVIKKLDGKYNQCTLCFKALSSLIALQCTPSPYSMKSAHSHSHIRMLTSRDVLDPVAVYPARNQPYNLECLAMFFSLSPNCSSLRTRYTKYYTVASYATSQDHHEVVKWREHGRNITECPTWVSLHQLDYRNQRVDISTPIDWPPRTDALSTIRCNRRSDWKTHITDNKVFSPLRRFYNLSYASHCVS